MSTVSDEAVDAALRVLTGKALFVTPDEMRAALGAARPIIIGDYLAAAERREAPSIVHEETFGTTGEGQREGTA